MHQNSYFILLIILVTFQTNKHVAPLNGDSFIASYRSLYYLYP